MTVLLAPEDYMSRPATEFFDLRITYEEATAALRVQGDPRSIFLADTLEVGVDVCRRGYVMVPDSAVTTMWMACWNTSRRVAPRLNFQKPGPKPRRSTWIRFRDAEGFSNEITRGVCVVYKAGRGQADLQFPGTAAADLEAVADGLLDETMRVVSATRSASIRIAVPPLEFGGPIEDQEPAIEEGFRSLRASPKVLPNTQTAAFWRTDTRILTLEPGLRAGSCKLRTLRFSRVMGIPSRGSSALMGTASVGCVWVGQVRPMVPWNRRIAWPSASR